MSGHIHKVSRSTSKNPALFDKYQCPSCNHLLKDAVQLICGHWLCECCAYELLAESLPKCPKLDCQEFLKSDEEGAECFPDRFVISPLLCFPDRFVRREVEGMIVGCPHQLEGCQWEGRLAKLETHLKACDFLSEECNLCGVVLIPDQIGLHGRVCPKALMKCPFVWFGCHHTRTMTREELKQHINDHGLEHCQSVADCLDDVTYQNGDFVERDGAGENSQSLYSKGSSEKKGPVFQAVVEDPGYPSMHGLIGGRVEDQEFLHATPLAQMAKITTVLRRKDEEIATLKNKVMKMERAMRSKHADFEDRDFSQRMADAQSGKYTSIVSLPFFSGRDGYKMCQRMANAQSGKYTSMVIESTSIHAASQQATSPHPTKAKIHYAIGRPCDYNYLAERKAWENELLEKDKKISSLSSSIAKLKERFASFSKVESCIHGNTFEWKISLLNHKIKYARSGYLFPSYPFYSEPKGYKMCLQLYILGDGSGRGTHMSLFFVIMKGDFDDLLKWPFTSKVTIKLINQRGGRDISGTFQPDPKSSSFQKPTSDMNISSGFPRFVSHTELNEGGFVVDDVVYLQCLVDRSSIK